MQVVFVEVVVPDGGGDDEAHAGALEQCFVAMGACAHHEYVGISHVVRTDVAAFQIDGLFDEFFYLPFDVGNLVVDNSFHGCKVR